MAKGKSDKKGGGGGGVEDEQEQKLQAILLADSFNTNFRPISSDMPKVGRFFETAVDLYMYSILGSYRCPQDHNSHVDIYTEAPISL